VPARGRTHEGTRGAATHPAVGVVGRAAAANSAGARGRVAFTGPPRGRPRARRVDGGGPKERGGGGKGRAEGRCRAGAGRRRRRGRGSRQRQNRRLCGGPRTGRRERAARSRVCPARDARQGARGREKPRNGRAGGRARDSGGEGAAAAASGEDQARRGLPGGAAADLQHLSSRHQHLWHRERCPPHARRTHSVRAPVRAADVRPARRNRVRGEKSTCVRALARAVRMR